jgi:hypothetical protein
VPFLDATLTPEIDGHASERYERMRETYAVALRANESQ